MTLKYMRMKTGFGCLLLIATLIPQNVFADQRNVLFDKERSSVGILANRKVVEQKKGKLYSLQVEYPKFTGTSPAIIELNQRIFNFVHREPDVSHPKGPPPGYQNEKYSYSTSYSIKLATPDLVSIDFSFQSYTGGAHGNTYDKVFNYQLRPFKMILLSDVFGGKTDYTLLSELCKAKLYRKLPLTGPEFMDVGAASKAENFQNFTFDRKGLNFIFGQYQVAPYCEGMPETSLSLSELKPLVPQSSPLYVLVKNAQPDTRVIDVAWRKKDLELAFQAHERKSKLQQ